MGTHQEEIRELINKWFKKQTRMTDGDGKFRGYIITKSQAMKLKTELWRHFA